MSREEDFEREWRKNITSKLSSIEESLKHVELSVNSLNAARISYRIEKAEDDIEKLKTFQTRVITFVVAAQMLFGGIFAALKLLS